MKAQTVLDQIEVTQSGNIHVQFRKQILSDDGKLMSEEFHRTGVQAGGDIDTQFIAVNNHLQEMGFPAVDQSDIDQVKSHAALKWGKA